MLQKERSISVIFMKNIFQLLKVYFFWMLIYGLQSCISLYSEGLANIRVCINAMVKSVLFGQYHTWFIFTLIALYLITPFLILIVQDKKRMEFFIILSIIFTTIIPMLRNIESFNRLSDALANFNMHFVTGYVLYYILGFYISQMVWTSKHTLYSVFLFIISLGSSCFLTMQESLLSGSATQESFGEFSLLALLTTVSFFGIIRGMEHISFSSGISRITSLGFGIYLMHPLFLDLLKPITDFKIFAAIPLLYMVCIIICFMISKSKWLSFFFLK